MVLRDVLLWSELDDESRTRAVLVELVLEECERDDEDEELLDDDDDNDFFRELLLPYGCVIPESPPIC